MIQFELVLQHVGGIGAAQIIVLVFYSYCNLPAGWNAMASVFIANKPATRCNVPPIDNTTHFPNLNESDILNLTIPYDPTNEAFDECHRYYQNLESCTLNLTCINQTNGIVPCDYGYHYDTSIFTETVVTEFDLVCDNKYLNTIATSLYYLGMLVGSFAFGNFADAFGRKLCCIITFIGCLVCMFGLSFSHSLALFIILRFETALFAYGAKLGTFVYIMEVTGEKWRTTFGICYQIAFPLGYMILGGVAYNWRNWHEIMLVLTLLSLPLLIFALIIPESPRWLFAKNKIKDGMNVTKLMARLNHKELPEDLLETCALKEKSEKETSGKQHSFIDLFHDRSIMFITLNVMFNWFANNLVYYGVTLNAGALAGDLFLNNTLNGVMEIGSQIICLFLLDRIGRRITLSASSFLAGIGLLASAIVNEYAGNNQTPETLGVVFAFAGKVGISAGNTILYNLTSELYPTVLRSNGVGIGSMASRIGGMICPFVISLQDYVSWLPNTIFGVFGIAAALLSLAFPETNHHPMMETLEEAIEFYKNGNKSIRKNSVNSPTEFDNDTFEDQVTKL